MLKLVKRFNMAFLVVLVAAALTACQSVPGTLSKHQIRVLQQEGFALTDDGWAFNLSGKVLFGFDDESLSDESKTIIAHLSKTLQDIHIYTLRIEGHTDAMGTEAYNKALSLRRAQQTTSEFVRTGMKAVNIAVVGHGADKPVADNDTAEGRQENRRVAIIVIP